MVTPSYLLSLALLYICILFAVAWYADRHANRNDKDSHWFASSRWRGIVYALSLAVYCSSWTFYGAVGSATESAWSLSLIHISEPTRQDTRSRIPS